MGADAFAPWHIILLVIVLVLLFGAKRLPGAARSLGQSMHIFKQSVSGLNPEDDSANPANPAYNVGGFSASTTATSAAPQLSPSASADATQAQLADLQRRVAELQKQTASGDAGQPSQPF
jgi:sec-independent protein translocase protein TatA